MKQFIFSIILLLFAGGVLFAQEENAIKLSLKECVQMAVEKNINVESARIDERKNALKKEEALASILPKINFTGSFQDNLQLPTTVLPGEFLGKPGTTIGVQMGSQYNTNASLSISQVLFNQTAFTALQLSKKLSEISPLSVKKASEEIAVEVAKLYFLTLTTAEQQTLIEENITRTERLKNITKITVENGIGKQIDLDRVSVNLENIYTQLNNSQATWMQQMNMIKFILDIPLEQSVVLTDHIETLILNDTPRLVSDFSNQVDILMLESQKEINLINQKVIQGGYLPSLSFSGTFAYQGLRKDFKNYFNDSDENQWYNYSNIGLNLSIPIFDGFEKRAKSRQAKLDYDKTLASLENTKERINMNYQNALSLYQNNKNIVRRQKLNLELATKVYDETALKYREGLASMSNLLQDEISLNSAQAGYLTALYNLKDAELKIISLNGEIEQIINK